MIRVALPLQLRVLARLDGEVALPPETPATINGVVDALEAMYPSLLGTIREAVSRTRRPYLRYYVCEEDWSDQSLDEPLPAAVAEGREPVLIVGAVSGG